MARGSRLARLAALGLLGVLTLTGCSMPNNEFWRFGWPEGITDTADSDEWDTEIGWPIFRTHD